MIFITAFLLNIVKKLYVAMLWLFFCVQTSDLLLIPYGSCFCICIVCSV